MMTGREQRIRMLAYRIWESEGRPDGQEARHWEMAERIVEAENAREEEQEWRAVSDEPSPLEGEEPTAEPDEIGIDEPRLPLDDPETEARKEQDTGVEVRPPQPRTGSPARRKAASSGEGTSPARKRGAAKVSGGVDKKPATKPRKPRGTNDGKSE